MNTKNFANEYISRYRCKKKINFYTKNVSIISKLVLTIKQFFEMFDDVSKQAKKWNGYNVTTID